MRVDDPREDAARTRVVEAYLEYLDRAEADAIEFDAFCAERPEIRDELAEIHGQWSFVESVLDRAGLDLRAEAEESSAEGPMEGSPGDADLDANWNREFLARLARRRSDLLQRYELREVLARGSMGTVWRVWDRDLGRHLAMKVLDDPVVQDGEHDRHLARFLDEARIASQLSHPGIPPIYEVGVGEGDCVYFTMKLVEGGTLLDLLERGVASLDAVLEVLIKTCDAMAYAHSTGVLHRDLKPSNVMVGEYGEVAVVDWGLARPVHRREPAASPAAPVGGGSLLETQDRELIGTPAYMAPEQADSRADRIGPWTDVHAVGAMLYHALSGHPPYCEEGGSEEGDRTSLGRFLERVKTVGPTPLDERVEHVPVELQSICEKAMARDPAGRYRDMRALADDLRAYREGRVVRAFRTGPLHRLEKWVLRNKLQAAGAIAALALILGGVMFALTVRARQAATRDMLRLYATEARIDDLRERARFLWPPRPELLPAYRAWTNEAYRVVEAWNSRGYAELLADLRLRARSFGPATSAVPGADRYEQWSLGDKVATLAALRRAQRVRDGLEDPVPAELDWSQRSAEPEDWIAAAWPLVHPTRSEFGRETEGWALSLRAVRESSDPRVRAGALSIVAWAQRALGRDAEALRAAEEALALRPGRASKELAAQMRNSLEVDHAGRIAQLEHELAEQRRASWSRQEWGFSDPGDQGLHDQLVRIEAGVQALIDPETGLLDGVTPTEGWGIQRRMLFASAFVEEGMSRSELQARWAVADLEIARHPRYAGLRLPWQLDLYPLGPDPESGLWEFAHLQTGAPPGRDEDGQLILREETALVLVLLPGGHFDRLAEGQAQRVDVSPFFLSKFEMTQGQWESLTGHNPSRFTPGYRSGGESVTLVHPVEEVSWLDSRRILHWAGLSHPSEAQWEYAARGGDDATARVVEANFDGAPDTEPATDPFDRHAPVGSFRGNALGLHDMFGNVREWCLDGYQSSYRRWGLSTRDPLVDPDRSRWRARLYRIVRGGSFEEEATAAAPDERDRETPDYRAVDLGLRPMRPIGPWDEEK